MNKQKYFTKRNINLQIHVFENEIKATKNADKKLIRIWTPNTTLFFIVNNSAIKESGKVFCVTLNNLFDVYSAVVDNNISDAKPVFESLKLSEFINVLDQMDLIDRKLKNE